MTQILISLMNKCARGVGFAHQGDTVALLSHSVLVAVWMLKDESSGVRGTQPPHSFYTSQISVLALLSTFLGIVFATGSFPAVQSFSQLALISRMLL